MVSASQSLGRSRLRTNRAILARQTSTHAAITHLRRAVAFPGLSGANILMRSTLGHLPLTCQARRPPWWAPRHVIWPIRSRVALNLGLPPALARRKSVVVLAQSSRPRARDFRRSRTVARRVVDRTGESSAPRPTAAAHWMIQPLTPGTPPSAYPASPARYRAGSAACPASTTITPYGSSPLATNT